MTEGFTELLITLFSSAGLAGALFAALLSHVLKKARADADRRRRRAAADARRFRTGTLRRSGAENGAGRIQQLSGKKQGAQGQAGRRAHRALSAYGADGGQIASYPYLRPFTRARKPNRMWNGGAAFTAPPFFFMSRRTAVKRRYARNSKTRTYPDSAVTIYSASASQPAFVKCLGMISDLYCSALRTILRKYNGLRTRSQTKRPVAFR